MAITEVRYGRTINTGNYENERYDVTVTLEPGQTPEDGVYEARAFIARQRQQVTEAQRLEERVRQAKFDLEYFIQRLEVAHEWHVNAAQAYEKFREALKEQGVDQLKPMGGDWGGCAPQSKEDFARLIAELRAAPPELFPEEDNEDKE